MSRHHRNLNTRHWERVRRAVLDKAGWRCAVCGRYGHHVDHVVPLEARGAEYDEDNLQCLCRECHREKTRREAIEAGRTTPGREAWRDLLEELVESNNR